MRLSKKLKVSFILLLVAICLPVLTLFVLAKIHHQTVHDEFVAFLNDEFGDNVQFKNLKLSYLHSFPNARISLDDVVLKDDSIIISTIGEVNLSLNPFKLIQKKIELKNLLIRDVTFNSVIDSLGNKPKLLAGKSKKDDSTHGEMLIRAELIRIKNCRLFFANEVKGNKTGIYIETAALKLRTVDSVLQITGELKGKLDSLVSNRNMLFHNQPIEAQDVVFNINRYTKKKEVVSGIVRSNSLELSPRLMMQPHKDGNLVELHIDGEDNFDVILGLFDFHLNLKAEQTNPDAKLRISYNQKGFVNPFLRPYSELDFSIINAQFEGTGLPFPVEVKEISGNYNNGEAHGPQSATLQVDTLNTLIHESYVHGRLLLKNLRDPYIDAHIVAGLDMEHMLPQKGNIRLTGSIDLDLNVDGKISEIKQFHLENKQQAFGNIQVHNLTLVLNEAGYSIELLNGNTILNNHILEVTTLVGTFNESAFHFEGLLENLDGFIVPNDQDLIGNFALHFDEIEVTKIDPGKQSDSQESNIFSALPDLSLEIILTGDKLISQIGDFSDIKLDCRVNQESLLVNEIQFDYKAGRFKGKGALGFDAKGLQNAEIEQMTIDFEESHSELNGALVFDSSGIKKANLFANLQFQTFDFSEFEKNFRKNGKDSASNSAIQFPEQLNIDFKLNAEKLIYKDAVLANTQLHLEADEKNAFLHNLNTTLPFGSLSANGSIKNYRDQKPDFTGKLDLLLDTIDVNRIMAMQVLGLPNIEGKRQKPRKKAFNHLPDNISFNLSVAANRVQYNNVNISDLKLLFNYQPTQIELNKLDFEVTDGMLKVHGHINHLPGEKPAGYLYSNANSLDINKIFRSFENFNQDVFTDQNTKGIISWSSHYYFTLDSNLVPLVNEDTWIINANVHEAHFKHVEPIEKTLFFVGHKAKDDMLVSNLNMTALMFQNKLYIRDVFMNDNIADLGLFGQLDLDENDMNLNIELSLSDLFFRSKKKRTIQTEEGEMSLDKDSKIFLKMVGPFKDGKISIQKKRDFLQTREELDQVIRSAAEYYKQKQNLQ